MSAIETPNSAALGRSTRMPYCGLPVESDESTSTDAGHVAQVLHHGLGVFLQLVHVGAADHVLDAGGAEAAARHERHRRDADPQVLGDVFRLRQDVLPHEVHHVQLAVFAVGDVDQPDVDRALVRVPLVRVGHAGDRVLDAVELADVAGDPGDHHLRGLQRRPLGGLNAQLELRRVLVGSEAHRQRLQQRDHRRHAAGRRPATTNQRWRSENRSSTR